MLMWFGLYWDGIKHCGKKGKLLTGPTGHREQLRYLQAQIGQRTIAGQHFRLVQYRVRGAWHFNISPRSSSKVLSPFSTP
jgi:hypothetical protein